MVFNFNPRHVSCNRIIQALNNEIVSAQDIEYKYEQSVMNIIENKSKWKSRYDSRHAKPRLYNMGGLVMVDYVHEATVNHIT